MFASIRDDSTAVLLTIFCATIGASIGVFVGLVAAVFVGWPHVDMLCERGGELGALIGTLQGVRYVLAPLREILRRSMRDRQLNLRPLIARPWSRWLYALAVVAPLQYIIVRIAVHVGAISRWLIGHGFEPRATVAQLWTALNGDHRFAVGPIVLWYAFLVTTAIAAAIDIAEVIQYVALRTRDRVPSQHTPSSCERSPAMARTSTSDAEVLQTRAHDTSRVRRPRRTTSTLPSSHEMHDKRDPTIEELPSVTTLRFPKDWL